MMSISHTQTQTRVLYAEPHQNPTPQKKKAYTQPKYATQEKEQNELTEVETLLIEILQSAELPSNAYALLDEYRARLATLSLDTPEDREEMGRILEDVLFEIVSPNDLEQNLTLSILSLIEEFCTQEQLQTIASRRIQTLLGNIQNNKQFAESEELMSQYTRALKTLSLADEKGIKAISKNLALLLYNVIHPGRSHEEYVTLGTHADPYEEEILHLLRLILPKTEEKRDIALLDFLMHCEERAAKNKAKAELKKDVKGIVQETAKQAFKQAAQAKINNMRQQDVQIEAGLNLLKENLIQVNTKREQKQEALETTLRETIDKTRVAIEKMNNNNAEARNLIDRARQEHKTLQGTLAATKTTCEELLR